MTGRCDSAYVLFFLNCWRCFAQALESVKMIPLIAFGFFVGLGYLWSRVRVVSHSTRNSESTTALSRASCYHSLLMVHVVAIVR